MYIPNQILEHYIPDKKTILMYDNTDGEGGITSPLKDLGYDCMGTDIRGGTNGRAETDSVDCFAHPPQKGRGYNVLTGNCPFIHKMRYWINCIASGIPYFIILPAETISLVKMQPFLRDHKFDVFYLSPKPSFTKDGSTKRVCIGQCVWIFGNWGDEVQGVLSSRVLSDFVPPALRIIESIEVSDISDDSDSEDIDDLTISIIE